MARYEYMRLTKEIISQEIVDEYNIMDKIKYGFIVCEIRRGVMYFQRQ